MAIQFVNNVDFNANQAQSIRIENVATDPSTELVIGRIIFNTAADTLKQYVADAGGGSPGWVEVGSSSGVETLTATQGTFISFTAASSATGDVDLGTFDISATGSPSATTFLRGDNTWAVAGTVTSVGLTMPSAFTVTNSPVTGSGTLTVTGAGSTSQYIRGDGTLATFPTIPTVPSNIVETVTTTDGTYINLTPNTATDGAVTVTADLSATDGTASSGERYLTKSNTWATIASIPGTYEFEVSADTGTSQDVQSADTLGINGGTNINTVVSGGPDITINLDDSISLSGSLTVGTTGGFTGQVTVPTATAGTSAPNLAQVQSLVAGVGVFQGGYNAITNSPALTGGSNIALDQGDYFAVTDSNNTSFLGTILEVGDLIFAANDITANSTPSASDYTIVQSGQSIAGEGATDGATIKGIAGFNSAHFSVTSNGWVSADIATASAIGIGNVNAATANDLLGVDVSYSSGTASVGLDVDGLTEDLSPAADDTIAIYDTSTSTNKKATLANIASAIDISKGVRISLDGSLAYITRTAAGGLTTFAVAVNNSSVLSATDALDVKAEITTAAGQTVYADITRSGTTLNVIFAGSVANGTYSALLVDVG
jgi:hypothetical protein